MHKNIFWLDDKPDFLSIQNIKKLSDGKINRGTLLENTVFAYDYSSAEDILKSGKYSFDLHIIDADFPLKIDNSQREVVEEYIRKMREQKGYIGDIDGGFKNQYYNAFVEFVMDNILPQNKNFVIHSMSSEAEKLSCLLGWPFYAKFSLKVFEVPVKRREVFYHNDVTSCVPGEMFEKIYSFIKKSKRWEPHDSLEGFFQSKEIPELKKNWEYGDYRDLVRKRIVPLFED